MGSLIEYADIWEAVEAQLESLDRGDLTDRLSQERHEESQRHEAGILAAQREAEERMRDRCMTAGNATTPTDHEVCSFIARWNVECGDIDRDQAVTFLVRDKMRVMMVKLLSEYPQGGGG